MSDLPRNRDQAKYARRGHTTTTNFEHIDSLAILLEQCKGQQINRDELPFVREVTGAPGSYKISLLFAIILKSSQSLVLIQPSIWADLTSR